MTHSEFNSFKTNICNECNEIHKSCPLLTKGHIILNILKKDFPNIIKRILNTKIDPTFDDDKLNEFWNILEKKLL